MTERVLVLTVFMALAANPACGADAPMDRATLRGLKTLQVAVDVGAELQQAGITRATLAGQVRQRLEKAGITIDPDAVDFVGVKVTAAQSKNTPYALCLELGIYQGVTLRRDPTMFTTAETWSGESVLLSPKKLLQDALTTTINDLVDQFVAAFKSVNPGP